jgi:hypothetical protein
LIVVLDFYAVVLTGVFSQLALGVLLFKLTLFNGTFVAGLGGADDIWLH